MSVILFLLFTKMFSIYVYECFASIYMYLYEHVMCLVLVEGVGSPGTGVSMIVGAEN